MTAKRKPKPPIPPQKTEELEQAFWQEHDSADYIDWSQADRMVLPHLKPTLRTISLRLPESMIAHLKMLANRQDVPYQSLLKIILSERLELELGKSVHRPSSAK